VKTPYKLAVLSGALAILGGCSLIDVKSSRTQVTPLEESAAMDRLEDRLDHIERRLDRMEDLLMDR
jgi:hypothetical protein